MLGGVTQSAALEPIGSTSSGAQFQFADFFAGTGVLRLIDDDQPGDHNGDGVVDAADHVAWKKFRRFSAVIRAAIDAFKENFGEGGPGGGGAAGVPEPTVLVLIALAVPLLITGRRCRVVDSEQLKDIRLPNSRIWYDRKADGYSQWGLVVSSSRRSV